MTREQKIHEVNVELVNMMMEKYGITYDEIISHLDENKSWKIDGVDWYEHYTLTEDEYAEFRKKGIELIRKKLKLNKRLAEDEFSWFNLHIGLKVVK